jgi:hypothetical protein
VDDLYLGRPNTVALSFLAVSALMTGLENIFSEMSRNLPLSVKPKRPPSPRTDGAATQLGLKS